MRGFVNTLADIAINPAAIQAILCHPWLRRWSTLDVTIEATTKPMERAEKMSPMTLKDCPTLSRRKGSAGPLTAAVMPCRPDYQFEHWYDSFSLTDAQNDKLNWKIWVLSRAMIPKTPQEMFLSVFVILTMQFKSLEILNLQRIPQKQRSLEKLTMATCASQMAGTRGPSRRNSKNIWNYARRFHYFSWMSVTKLTLINY